MSNGDAHARVVSRFDAGNAGLDLVRIRLIHLFDAIELAAFAGHSRKAVNGIAIAQDLERFTQKHEALPFRVVDPPLGGAAHVDHEDNSDIPFTPFKARQDPLTHFLAVEGVNPGANQRIEINLVTNRLLAYSLDPGPKCFKATAQGKYRTPIFFNGLCVKSRISSGHIPLTQDAPVLAVVAAAKIPLVVDINGLVRHGLSILRRVRGVGLSAGVVALASGRRTGCGD